MQAAKLPENQASAPLAFDGVDASLPAEGEDEVDEENSYGAEPLPPLDEEAVPEGRPESPLHLAEPLGLEEQLASKERELEALRVELNKRGDQKGSEASDEDQAEDLKRDGDGDADRDNTMRDLNRNAGGAKDEDEGFANTTEATVNTADGKGQQNMEGGEAEIPVAPEAKEDA
eukprot:scaffold7067_cov245-Pinguiococcus_pyrenoidosus.AAC.1